MRVVHLKSAHLIDPFGINIRRPLFTWNCKGGVKQTAYQITAGIDGAEFWNTGKV